MDETKMGSYEHRGWMGQLVRWEVKNVDEPVRFKWRESENVVAVAIGA